MPGYLVHQNAIVTCSHLGLATPSAPSPQVFVLGQAVATTASGYTVKGCQLPTITSGAPPCVSAIWTYASLQVSANNVPVLLTDSQSQCVPTGTPLLIGVTQLQVSGV